jgi:hypothetical protein
MVERQSLDIPLSSNDPAKTVYDNVDLSHYLTANGGRRGIFVLKLSPQDDPAERTFDYSRSSTSDLRFIVVTDLGIIAKRSSDGSHDVYVQSIGSGSPVPTPRSISSVAMAYRSPAATPTPKATRISPSSMNCAVRKRR